MTLQTIFCEEAIETTRINTRLNSIPAKFRLSRYKQNLACNKDKDQSVHLCNLISVFAICLIVGVYQECFKGNRASAAT